MFKRSLFGVMHRNKYNKIQCVEAETKQIQTIHLGEKLINNWNSPCRFWILCHWKFKN